MQAMTGVQQLTTQPVAQQPSFVHYNLELCGLFGAAVLDTGGLQLGSWAFW